MKYILIISISILISGCQSVIKDIFEIAATPEELSQMSAIDVCSHLGYSQWRNQPQAYLDAKAEAVKRISKGEVNTEDCIQFSKMAMRKKDAAREQMYRAESIRKEAEISLDSTTINCRESRYSNSISCATQNY